MVLTSTLTDIGFVDAAVVALLGYAVVFFGLVLLMMRRHQHGQDLHRQGEEGCRPL